MEELNGYVLINNKRYPFAFTDDKLKLRFHVFQGI